MYKYWKVSTDFGYSFNIYEISEEIREKYAEKNKWTIEEIGTEGPLIKLWTVTNDHGDGSSSSKIFSTKEEADTFAENDEYFPEVHSTVIDVSKFQKVSLSNV